METGTVRFFKINEFGGYGFITVSSGTDLYFEHSGGGVVALGRYGPGIDTWLKPRLPVVGDVILLKVSHNRRGQIAKPWCFKKDWDEAQQMQLHQTARSLLSEICTFLELTEKELARNQPQSAAACLKSPRLTSAFDSLGSADESLQQAVAALEGQPYQAVIAAFNDRRKDLTALVSKAVESAGSKWQTVARGLVTRFQASIETGNYGAAMAALCDIQRKAENMAGLETHCGSREASEKWLETANSSLAELWRCNALRKRNKKLAPC